MECIFCKKIINNKGSLIKHQNVCVENPNRIKYPRSPFAGAKKGVSTWSKGLTKKDHPGLARPKRIGVKFGASLHGHSNETKTKLSRIAKERKLGGYVKGSGRGKKGWYKGIFCDSSWELAYVIYCLDHNISICRNTEKRTYVWENKEYNYLPDFVVEGKLIEIKGWRTPIWEAKLASNKDVTVLYENDLKHVFNYVVDKYSKNFINMYEGN
jgi:hypothetical protein